MLFPLYDENPTRRISWVNYSFILINLAVLVWMMSLPSGNAERVMFERGFIPARIQQLKNNQPLVIRPQEIGNKNPGGQARKNGLEQEHRLEPILGEVMFSLLSAMFMHAGVIHFVSNMWFLFVFGNNIEDRLGHFGYAFFYLACGLLATACHWFNDPLSIIPVIGASGAVAGVLGAYAVTYPTAKIRTLLFFVILLNLPAWLVLGLWFIGQVLEAQNVMPGNLNGGVAWWAHVGGFAAGALMMPLLTFARLVDEDDDSWLNFEDERFVADEKSEDDALPSLPGPRF